MKQIIIFGGLFLIQFFCFGQNKSSIDANILKDTSKLVSNYTFKRLVQKDFATITTGENSFSKIGKYATLDINSDESKFYFSPLVFISKQDPLEGPFKSIHSIDISGAINSSNVFDFKKKNTVSLSYSLTKVFDKYKFLPSSKDVELLQRVRGAAIDKLEEAKENALTNVLDSLDNADFINSPKKYKKKLLETIADYEENWADDKWTKKKISWLKINFTLLSFDNFYLLDNTNPSSYDSPISESIFVPALNISYNSFRNYSNLRSEFYYSIWLKGSIKHTLSEFSETSEWVKYEKLSDTTFVTADKNDVYILNEADLEKKFKIDFGAQIVYLFHLTAKVKAGIDISGSYKSLVASSGANATNLSIGIIFPFLDKDGEATINIEPFYSFTKFSNIELDNKNFWGVRFGLPFNKL